MRKSAQENLLEALIIIYGRSQESILTSDLFRGEKIIKGEKSTSVYQDTGAGKNYPLRIHIEAKTLEVTKVWSEGKKEVRWHPDAGYPDMALANLVWKTRKNMTAKEKLAKEKNKVVESLTEKVEADISDDVQSQDLSPVTMNEIIERFDAEYLGFKPYNSTIPKVKTMLGALKHNATDIYCHKTKLFCTVANKDGEFIDVSHQAGTHYTLKRLTRFNVLERNPNNKNEYECVAEYDDVDEYVRKLVFCINHLVNKRINEKKREERLALALMEKEKEKCFVEDIEADINRDVVEEVVEEVPTIEEVVETSFSTEIIEAITTELKVTREGNQRMLAANQDMYAGNQKMYEANQDMAIELRQTKEELSDTRTELKEMREVNKLISDDLSEKMVGLHKVTIKFTEAVKVNNLISEK